MTKRLKPCPFCGSKPSLIKGWMNEQYVVEIKCYGCYASMSGAGDDAKDVEQNIRDRWNRRAE